MGKEKNKIKINYGNYRSKNIDIAVEIPAIDRDQKISRRAGKCIIVIRQTWIADISRGDRANQFVCAHGRGRRDVRRLAPGNAANTKQAQRQQSNDIGTAAESSNRKKQVH